MKKMKRLKIGLAFVDDKTMHKLNKTYRNVNEPTDVLAFPYNDELPEGVLFLGEIVVNVDEVKTKEEILERVGHGARNLLRNLKAQNVKLKTTLRCSNEIDCWTR